MASRGGAVGQPGPHVVESDVDGNIGLYDSKREEVLVLNETASDVWRLCDGEHTLDEIVDLLARAYGIDADKIRGDVAATIDTFVRQGLLTERTRP